MCPTHIKTLRISSNWSNCVPSESRSYEQHCESSSSLVSIHLGTPKTNCPHISTPAPNGFVQLRCQVFVEGGHRWLPFIWNPAGWANRTFDLAATRFILLHVYFEEVRKTLLGKSCWPTEQSLHVCICRRIQTQAASLRRPNGLQRPIL